MRKLRVQKGLGKVTRALEAYVETVEAHYDLKSVRESGEKIVHMFHKRCNPRGSYVF